MNDFFREAIFLATIINPIAVFVYLAPVRQKLPERDFLRVLFMATLISMAINMFFTITGEWIFRSVFKIDFNSYVIPQVEIDNIGDSIVTTTLGLEAFDKYGNTVYKYFLPIQANDDGYVYERVEKSGQHSLMYTPTGQVYMTIHASEVKVDNTGNIINVSIPDGYIAYVKYKPAHMNQAVFSKITDEISISSDWQIKLTDYSCAHLEYRYIVHVFNPELTQINSTPIIKRLAIVQAEV